MTINPADCDLTTVYAGECRNFPDTAWVRFDSGRRRASEPADGRAWLVDYGNGSYWCRDDQVRNLVPLVPATGGQWTPDDISDKAIEKGLREGADTFWDMKIAHVRWAILDDLNARHPKPEALDTDALAEVIRRAAEASAQTVAQIIRDTLGITEPPRRPNRAAIEHTIRARVTDRSQATENFIAGLTDALCALHEDTP